MGIMNDIGVLDADNNLVEGIWNRYVQDVKNKLKGENLEIFENINCSPIPPPPPNPQADLLKLEDEQQFPEFRSTWYPRYQEMARGLNTDGGFNPAIPIADPTAIIAATGATPPDMGLAEAVAGALAVGAVQPPKNPAALVPVVFPNLSPDELIAKTPELGPKIGEALALPPLPPIPPIPNPKLFELGYAEQFAFDAQLAKSPLETFKSMMENIGQLPGIIADLPGGPQGLIEFVCAASEPSQPKRMETSDVEEAASQVLKQHQVRIQAGQFLGSNIGSGAITKAVVTGPMQLTPVDEEIDEVTDIIQVPTAASWAGTLSARRRQILNILEEIFDQSYSVKGGESRKYTGCQYPSPSKAEKKEKADEAAKKAEEDFQKAQEIYKQQVAQLENNVKYLKASNSSAADIKKAEDALAAAKKKGVKKKSANSNTSHEAGQGWLAANGGIAGWKGPGTSCGLLPPLVFRRLGVTEFSHPHLTFHVPAGVWVPNKSGKGGSVELQNTIIGPLVPGPTNFKHLGILSNTFVWAWDKDGMPTGEVPEPGDIFVLSSGDDPSSLLSGIDPRIAEEDGSRSDTGVGHVGVMVEFNYEQKIFNTADFGQKPIGGNVEGGCYRRIKMKISEKGRIKVSGEGNNEFRDVIGWINVDLLQL